MLSLLALALLASPRPILITVDDLPVAGTELHPDAADREQITARLLGALGKHKVPAIGLVTTSKILGPADEASLQRWRAAGLELGNHSERHLSYTETSSAAYIEDVERARVRLTRLLGASPRFFRFPFLREGDTPAKVDAMRAYLERSGQRVLTVTIDDQDWSLEAPYVKAKRAGDAAAMNEAIEDYVSLVTRAIEHHEAVGDRVVEHEAPQILLLHATDVASASWDRLFSWLTAHGHRFATADEVLRDRAFLSLPRYVGTKGFGLWDRIRAERRRAEAKSAIAKLLSEQAAAWTRGDLVAFCSVYAEDATFISPTGMTRGRRAILERYQKKYGTAKETMGALELSVEELRLADGWEATPDGDAVPTKEHGATVIMRWRLTFPKKAPAEGLSMIALFPGSDGAWRIAQDASM